MPGNEVDSLGVPTFNASIVFYMLWGDAGRQNWLPGSAHIQRFYYALHALRGCWVTKMNPWECPHSTFLFCFTRFEKMSGNKLITCEWPHSVFLLCFTFLERMPSKKLDSPGVPTGNNYLVITSKCGLGLFEWGSALTYGIPHSRKRTHQSALTSSPIANECWVQQTAA